MQVVFRQLAEPLPADYTGYTYRWTLGVLPQIGDRVLVRGGDGRAAPAVVVAVGVRPPAGYSESELSEVIRVASAEEIDRSATRIERANIRAANDAEAWLRMMRRAAGLPTPGKARANAPAGFPPIPPAGGTASKEAADEFSRSWGKARRLAEDRGHDSDEVKAFTSLMFRWRAIRDRQ